MKAWLLDRLSGIKTTHLAEVPDPTAGPGEVIVRVEYAGLNPADAYLAEGQYPARPSFPHILGRDAVGSVQSVGEGVANVRVGQKVVVMRSEVGVNRPGTLAQQVAVPATSLTGVPEGWSDQEAAGAALVYLTAYQALSQWDGGPGVTAGPGQVVLVTGASGGVGVASVQLAKAMGHTVIGLSRSEEKGRKVRELGADVTFAPQDKLWPKKVREFLNPGDPKVKGGGRRVDLAVDNIGGTLLPEVIETLGMWGRVSLVGRLAGPVPTFNTATLFFRRLRLGGVAVGTYTHEESHAAWKQVLALLGKTGAKPVVDQVFPFEALHAAFDRMATGPMGKVLVKVGE